MSFAADVKRHTEQYRKRLSYVAKTATLEVTNEAQKVGPSVANPTGGKGGRMPVDTAFLRASLVGSTAEMPRGPTDGTGGFEAKPLTAELIRWKPGETKFWAGWTAFYARDMEYRYGFMRGATNRWQEFVRKAIAEAKRKKL